MSDAAPSAHPEHAPRHQAPDRAAEARRPPEHLSPLDVLVFAPTGLVLTAVEDLPALAARGRQRIEREIRSARAVGEMVVTFGHRGLRARLGALPPFAPPRRPPAGRPAARRPEPGPTEHRPTEHRPTEHRPTAPPPGPYPWPPTAAGRRADAPGRSESRVVVDLVIPGYDSLSASQVVRRLDSLRPAELEAVRTHEAATKGRRTILHRAQQLLDAEAAGDEVGPA